MKCFNLLMVIVFVWSLEYIVSFRMNNPTKEGILNGTFILFRLAHDHEPANVIGGESQSSHATYADGAF